MLVRGLYICNTRKAEKKLERCHKLEQKLGKSRITVAKEKAFTVIWEFNR